MSRHCDKCDKLIRTYENATGPDGQDLDDWYSQVNVQGRILDICNDCGIELAGGKLHAEEKSNE